MEQNGPLTGIKLSRIAKNIDPCQPARTAPADMGRYFSQMY